MTERKTAEDAVGHNAQLEAGKALPKPNWDSGNVHLAPLPPGSRSQWHTLTHNLGSTKLLVDAKLGGTNAQGKAVWSLSNETLFALTGPDTLTFRWDLDQDSWNYYCSALGLTGHPRLRVWIWRW